MNEDEDDGFQYDSFHELAGQMQVRDWIVEVSQDGNAWVQCDMHSIMAESSKYVRPYKNEEAAKAVAEKFSSIFMERKT